MDKLKKIIERWIYYGKPPVKGITPYQIDVLITVYHDLLMYDRAEFIQEAVLRVMEKCEIKTKAHGIGWIAYI